MAVPALALVEDLHVAHAALDEPAGDEAAAGVVVALLAADAVEFEHVLRFGGDVEGLLGRQLHAAGKFVALDARLQVGLARMVGRVFGVQRAEEFHLAFLRLALERGGRVEVEDVRRGGADERALVDRRQPAVSPMLVGEGRQAVRMTHHDVGRQVLGLAAEGVGRPGAHGRVTGRDASRLHGEHRLQVVIHARLHRADQADVVGDRAEPRQEFAEFQPALAVAGEFPERTQHLGRSLRDVVVFEIISREFLPVPLREHRLVVEEVHLRRPAHHEEGDHRLGLGRARRLLGQEVVGLVAEQWLHGRGEEAVLAKQGGESEHAEAEATGFDEVAAGAEPVGKLSRHGGNGWWRGGPGRASPAPRRGLPASSPSGWGTSAAARLSWRSTSLSPA